MLHFVGFFALYGHGVRLSSIELERSIQRDRDKPRRGVVASTLSLFRQRAIGFIDWLDLLMMSSSKSTGEWEKQDKRIEELTAQLKQQAAQIQKVSAQLELNRLAPQTVKNNDYKADS